MREQDPIKIIVGELLAPSNIKAYQKILNTPLTDEQNDYIDNSLKMMLWELQERKELVKNPLIIDLGDRVKIVNSTNKTMEDCIGIVTDLQFTEDTTIYLVQITQITTKALKAGVSPSDVVLVHNDELEKL